MKVFSAVDLNVLVAQAQSSPRLRQHQNIHVGFDEPCQRLFNAIEPGSYIRPHRHSSVPRDELLLAVRGLMALLTFDDTGNVTQVRPFGSEAHGPDVAAGVELPPSTWHTVLALTPGAVLLEVKAGPFDPDQPKDLAPWAPQEGQPVVSEYLNGLIRIAKSRIEFD